MATFNEKLAALWAEDKFVCLGIDPDLDLMPDHIKSDPSDENLYNFFVEIIDMTADVAAAFKPNPSFFDGLGVRGRALFWRVCKYIKKTYPDIVLIADAKCGDIGKTNAGPASFYLDTCDDIGKTKTDPVRFYFDACGADAITVQNYVGQQAMNPFLRRADKGVFVLCHTSNEGAGEFQDLPTEVPDDLAKLIRWPANQQERTAIDLRIPEMTAEEAQRYMNEHQHVRKRYLPLHQIVAARVHHFWNDKGNCGLVTGATFSGKIAGIRSLAGEMPFLVPGIGAQGGALKESVKAALVRDDDGNPGGFLINSSSGLTYTSKGLDFAEAARKVTLKLDNEIRAILAG